MELIGLIIFGAVVGVLARFFLKGDQNMGMVATIVLGVLGAILGYWIAGMFGVAQTKGIDWIRDIISIICAMGLISIYLGFMRSRNRSSIEENEEINNSTTV